MLDVYFGDRDSESSGGNLGATKITPVRRGLTKREGEKERERREGRKMWRERKKEREIEERGSMCVVPG